jgi:hypothetical protein
LHTTFAPHFLVHTVWLNKLLTDLDASKLAQKGSEAYTNLSKAIKDRLAVLKEKVAFTSKTDTPVPFREEQLTHTVSGNLEYLYVKLDTGELFTLKRENGGEWFVAKRGNGKTTNAEVLERVPGRFKGPKSTDEVIISNQNNVKPEESISNSVFYKEDVIENVNGGNKINDISDEFEIIRIAKEIKYLPGPQLPQKISFTFEGGIYKNRKLVNNEKYFKYHGANNRTGRKYAWYTNKKYSSESELRQKLAIRDDWGIQIEFVSELEVPAGNWVSEGKAASQGLNYPGQDYQAVIVNTSNSWIIKTTKAF